MKGFRYETDRWGPFEIHTVLDEEGAFGFSVAPGRGACLLGLQLQGFSLIDGYRNYSELARMDGARSAILAPFPNRLKDGRFEKGGRVFQFPLNDTELGNALHGMVLEKSFEVTGIETLSDRAAISLEYRYAGDLPWFPFPFAVYVLYEISRDAGFSIDLRLENTGEEDMPAGLGWHPYFQLGLPTDEMRLQLPAVERIEVDRRMIPTGEKTLYDSFGQLNQIGEVGFDTCFRLLNPGEGSGVLLEGGTWRMQYWQDSHLPYCQIFIPPSRQSIALEPMTCNVDAFNNGEGLAILPRGGIIGGRAGCRLEKIST